jgi:hypothetical protein
MTCIIGGGIAHQIHSSSDGVISLLLGFPLAFPLAKLMEVMLAPFSEI